MISNRTTVGVGESELPPYDRITYFYFETTTDMKKLNIILLSKEESSLTEVASVLAAQDGFEVTWLASAEQAWNYMTDNKIDVAVVSDGAAGLYRVAVR